MFKIMWTIDGFRGQKLEKSWKQQFQKRCFFRVHFSVDFGRGWGGFWEGFGRGLEALGASWAVCWRHFWVLVFGVLSGRALGASWARFWLDLSGSGEGLGRVLEVKIGVRGGPSAPNFFMVFRCSFLLIWGGLGKVWGGFWKSKLMLGGWVLLAIVGYWVLLTLSWSLSSKSVLAFAWLCVAWPCVWSMELILNLNSSWLYCLLWLTLACFCLLWLALAFFGCFGCLRFPFHWYSGFSASMDPTRALEP